VSSSNRLIVSILVVTALAIGFWMLALGPKRKEADELSSQAGQLQITLSEAESKAAEATAARQEFPADYRRLVVLGQAAPAGDETSSLLVELASTAAHAGVNFDSIQLEGSGEATAAAVPAPAPEAPVTPSPTGAVPTAATVPPTEAAASLLPLGASIGTAGLGVMPYSLTFSGNFFQIADFIKDIDSFVHTGAKSNIGVDGRLVTLNGFALNAEGEEEEEEEEEGTGAQESSALKATFSVTTYVTPPSQGITAGATASAPAPVASATGASATATESGTEAQ
jgi:Tfp pilus assembly protein PilO